MTVFGIALAVVLVGLGVGQLFSRPEDSRHAKALHRTSVFVIALFFILLGSGITWAGVSWLDTSPWFSAVFRGFAYPAILTGLICIAAAVLYIVSELTSK